MTMKKLAPLAAMVLATIPTAASAHVGHGGHGGFVHGLAHPFMGADHILAMVGVGLYAALLGGRALWLVPCAFVGMMLAGGILGFGGYQLPQVEAVIALSVVTIGLLIATARQLPTIVAMALVGGFALFHGHAHGLELPSGGTPAEFALGFIAATLLLHVAGISLGSVFRTASVKAGVWPARIAGSGMAVAGISMLA